MSVQSTTARPSTLTGSNPDESSVQNPTVSQTHGKGLTYDWRSIVAAVESADLDRELVQMNTTPARA